MKISLRMELTFSLDEIENAAANFLNVLNGYSVVALYGEMGAGKTTFISAVCKMLKVEDAISSPTFSIINQYKTTDGGLVYHLDLYRLKDEDEALNAGVEDCLLSGEICFVEWPGVAEGIFPDKTLTCELLVLSHNERKLRIKL